LNDAATKYGADYDSIKTTLEDLGKKAAEGFYEGKKNK
jgi:hypothetical protein